MRWLTPLAVLLLVGLSNPAFAQQPGPSSDLDLTEGDTAWVIIHHVRVYQRAAYERWADSVLTPAIRRIQQRRPDLRTIYAGRRRLLPTAPSRDGTLAYIYLYPEMPDLKGKYTGIRGMLEASGMNETQIDREFQRFLSFVREAVGYNNVVQERGWTQIKDGS